MDDTFGFNDVSVALLTLGSAIKASSALHKDRDAETKILTESDKDFLQRVIDMGPAAVRYLYEVQ